MAQNHHKNLLSSVVADIKSYEGSDPLRPWLHGIRSMKQSLPPPVLKEKLPRFLQKCAETFETDPRYRNDPRYLRVWIELMDYVDDAKVVLKKMERNGVGVKRAMFYLAYALYYEKHKKFEDAEKMYHVGVHNLAEPIGELQKSYEQFLRRMEMYRKRKDKLQEASKRGETSAKTIQPDRSNVVKQEGSLIAEDPRAFAKTSSKSSTSYDSARCFTDDITVVKFVDSAIFGKSAAEDACHHGLVDPTINMKEAMNAIGSMFKEPLELENLVKRRSNRSKPKVNQQNSGFEVFIDDCCDDGPIICSRSQTNDDIVKSHPNSQCHINQNLINLNLSKGSRKAGTESSFAGEFKILSDDEVEDVAVNNHMGILEVPGKDLKSAMHPRSNSMFTENSADADMIASGLNEETVHKFIGSTGIGETKVEDACHHGLIDPTINLKEAMDEINSMFGKPLDFKGEKQKKRQSVLNLIPKPPSSGFSILVDDDNLEEAPKHKPSSNAPSNFVKETDLFEPTVFTKEAMADINEMFGMPLDF